MLSPPRRRLGINRAHYRFPALLGRFQARPGRHWRIQVPATGTASRRAVIAGHYRARDCASAAQLLAGTAIRRQAAGDRSGRQFPVHRAPPGLALFRRAHPTGCSTAPGSTSIAGPSPRLFSFCVTFPLSQSTIPAVSTQSIHPSGRSPLLIRRAHGGSHSFAIPSDRIPPVRYGPGNSFAFTGVRSGALFWASRLRSAYATL